MRYSRPPVPMSTEKNELALLGHSECAHRDVKAWFFHWTSAKICASPNGRPTRPTVQLLTETNSTLFY